jgi:undecaprenyl-phosphate 4-deoxy-4-formamido-L-arabinose transferase
MMRAMQTVEAQRGSVPEAERRVSVVVPVFNSAGSIDELCERIIATLGSIPAVSDWELILVNDGSRDSSWERVVALSRAHPEVRGIDLSGNWGQHNALLAGIHAVRHEVIVTLDDDLQNPPEEIPRMLEALGPEVDVVYGVPIASAHPTHRRIGGTTLRAILQVVTGRSEARLGSGFRALRAKLVEPLPEKAGKRFVLDSALRTATKRIDSVAVKHEPRRIGRSNYSLPRLVRLAFTEIATDLPLKRRGVRSDPSYRVRTVTEPEPGRNGS